MGKKKFRIGQQKQGQKRTITPERIAQVAKQTLDSLGPLAIAKQMPPMEVLVLAAVMMDRTMTGKERSLTADEIHSICLTIVAIWKRGLFALSKSYPYSLEETLAAWEDRSDGSEVEA